MAASSPNSAAPLFMGEFRHAVDGKGRITIPSDWRFEDEAEFFLIPSSTSACLRVMPRQEIDRIRLEAATIPGPQRLETLRALGSGSRQCRLDKAGRLVLPPDFCRLLQLEGEVTLTGVIEAFEIWNSAVWSSAKPNTTAVATPHLAQFGL